MNLSEIRRILGYADVVSSGVNFRAPGHGPGDRSARLIIGPQYPDGFHVFSWAGDDWRALKDYVRDHLGWSRSGPNQEHAEADHAGNPVLQLLRRKRIASNLFEEAHYPAGTPVETYLTSREINLAEDFAGSVIRFHPACPWTETDNRPTILVPAMLAVMRSVHTNEITAVHRTRLTLNGENLGRKMLGIAAGSAIKLDANENVTQGLLVGEGVETCLAACQLGYRPVWALGSAGSIAKFPVLGGIDSLSVLAENDVNGTNERAITDLAERWHEAGREVLAVDPKFGKDINDAIRGVA